MRLFVSVALPARLVDDVAAIQDDLDDVAGCRLTDPAQAHVTLAFLGDVPDTDVPAIEGALDRAVERAGIAPFEADIGGLGAFPSPENPSVVWLGFERGGDRLTRLHDAVEAELEPLGFDPDDRPFTPHVTVARVDRGGDTEGVQRVLRDRSPRVGEMRVSEIRLTESTLTDDGPVYAPVASASLPA